MNGRTRDIAVAAYFGGLFVMVAMTMGIAFYKLDHASEPPMSATTPVVNEFTGTETPLTLVQRANETQDQFFDRVIECTIAFQKKLSKGK